MLQFQRSTKPAQKELRAEHNDTKLSPRQRRESHASICKNLQGGSAWEASTRSNMEFLSPSKVCVAPVCVYVYPTFWCVGIKVVVDRVYILTSFTEHAEFGLGGVLLDQASTDSESPVGRSFVWRVVDQLAGIKKRSRCPLAIMLPEVNFYRDGLRG